MIGAISKLPFFIVLMGIGAVAMLVPAVHAAALDDHHSMRVFFYGAILFGILTLLLGLATAGTRPDHAARSQLLTLVAAYTVLPLMLAIPFYEAVGTTTLFHAWFEMVSSFTTTGATLYDTIGTLTPSQHLWRALVGWLGGMLVWVTAYAIFAPMNLGGYEVEASGGVGLTTTGNGPRGLVKLAAPSDRLARATARLFPIYAGLTFLLWLALVICGETPFVALCHAMSVLATSGISPIDGIYYGVSGVAGEAVIMVFFIFAITRFAYLPGGEEDRQRGLRQDPEMRLAAVLIFGTTLALFMRHYVGALGEDDPATLAKVLGALWGGLFTVTSFLTTTGFESRLWEGATIWSGLETPGLFLVGLALIGGGVATTSGGVKLLRVYALFRHGEREMERLLHPSSVGGGGRSARRIRREGAYISWIFFMLFATSIAAVMTLLSLTGVSFEEAMVLSVAALSTTGPLAGVAAETPIAYISVPDPAKLVLALAMVLGRLETLAIIALFNPELWRR